MQPGLPQPGTLHLQQPTALVGFQHQHAALALQAEGHQQAQPPMLFTAGCQLDQGAIATPHDAGDQATQGEVMRPGDPVALQQGFQLLMGAGFQHRGSLGIHLAANGSG